MGSHFSGHAYSLPLLFSIFPTPSLSLSIYIYIYICVSALFLIREDELRFHTTSLISCRGTGRRERRTENVNRNIVTCRGGWGWRRVSYSLWLVDDCHFSRIQLVTLCLAVLSVLLSSMNIHLPSSDSILNMQGEGLT
ncbi:unnamed protein product [Brugia pahangi]|uniref:Transmembrane protein n=1 Tax=Brugia pahangi TaxID=6280 RepID=A0A0N4TV44_BRUPA|nr:unnamed protein product [Brugia pahangi]